MSASRERSVLRPTVREEVEEELSFHLEMRVRELVAGGLSEKAARAQALRTFGDLAGVQAECRRLGERRERGRRRGELFAELWQDLRFGVRHLRRAPTFAAIAILTLALGVGATTAMFSVMQAVLLRPLPFPDSGRLVVPTARPASGESWSITYADYLDWEQAKVFEAAAAYRIINVNVAGGAAPERLVAVQATKDFLHVLGVRPLLGRALRPEEHMPGSPRRALISYGLWQRRFGGDPAAVGSKLRMTGVDVEVMGVLPAGLSFPREADVWLPLKVFPEERASLERRDNFMFNGIARLLPGKTLAATNAELAALAARVAREQPAARAGVTMTAGPLLDELVGPTLPRTLVLMLVAVALVLVIGCVNVANLLLARSATRRRELGLRSALGASRARLGRQLLTEALVLGLTGGAVGLVVAWGAMRGLVALAPASIPRLDEVRLDLPVLGAAFAVSLFATLVFGAAPAWRLAATRAAAAAKEPTRSVTAARGRQRRVLVAVELALSLLLVVWAGLLLRSLGQLNATDPGFPTARLLTFSVSLQGDRYEGEELSINGIAELARRLAAVPGVQRSALLSSAPLGGGGFYLGRAFLAEGRPEPPAGREVNGQWSVVTPGAFAALGVPLLRGRDFTDGDTATSVPVMIVNREFARKMFPDVQNGDALGKRVRSWRDENVYREIVGIVDDVRFFGAGDEIRPLVYVPHRQCGWDTMVAVLRTTGAPDETLPAVRRAVAAFDAELPLDGVQTFDEVFATSVAPRRFGATLLASFAGLALLLALVGVYGVLSYEVAQRAREIGIRMAIGSRRADVLRMVVGEAAVLVVVGLAGGAAAALLAGRFVQPLLFETAATDAPTYLTAVALLGGVALLAASVPAVRAAASDPMKVMRAE
ncbi:MAG TPA: ABC transporter permease [Thermoanaerobaculia bacterium]|nr:ABC transporter permease [Thermoanaerobaculia bacterium]